jgi:hypothetical protein
MTGDGKLTTSHPVTECRNQPARSLADRALQGFWSKLKNLYIGRMNDAASPRNSGAKPHDQALVGRLYDFSIQFAVMRQIRISVGLLFC